MLAHYLAAFPDAIGHRAADRLLVSSIVVVISVLSGGSSIDTYQPVFSVVGIAVYAIVRYIARCVIRIVERAATGHAHNAIGWRASALLQRDTLDLIAAAHCIPYSTAIAPSGHRQNGVVLLIHCSSHWRLHVFQDCRMYNWRFRSSN